MFKYFYITNGEIDQEFKSDVLTYHVDVDDNITELKLNFEMEQGSTINIVGNKNFAEGTNNVYVELTKDNMLTTYNFIVEKKEIQTVTSFDNNMTKVEVANSTPFNVSPVLIIAFLLLIIMVGRIILKLKKSIKKA